MSSKKFKKIKIVIEENGMQEGKGFSVYLEGDIERITQGELAEKDMTPAEFYGAKFFKLCTNLLKNSGALVNISKKGSH